ncbi:MAG TPA: hypothetical protein PKI14_01645 [Fervidobacterium sp.]|nr:hypothetical protein [Fervidobacterium sp.]
MEAQLKDFFIKHKITPNNENNRSYQFDCPVCNGDSKLYVQKKDGRTVCFRQELENCPKKGSKPFYALSLIAGISIKQVKDEILGFQTQLGEDIDVNFDDVELVKKVEAVPDAILPHDTYFFPDEKAVDGMSYLNGRGIHIPDTIKYNIAYSPGDRRVIFPVFDGDRLIGYQGRAIDKVDKAFRMKNWPGRWRDRAVMFVDNLKNNSNKMAIIAEGPISAMKFELAKHFVATMGKEISLGQFEVIAEYGVKNIYLALDRDADDKIPNLVNAYKKIVPDAKFYKINVPAHRDDFGDCTYQEALDAFNGAEEVNLHEIFTHISFKIKDVGKIKV